MDLVVQMGQGVLMDQLFLVDLVSLEVPVDLVDLVVLGDLVDLVDLVAQTGQVHQKDLEILVVGISKI